MSMNKPTLGRPVAHANIVKEPAEQNPAYTDWKALGLDFKSPFDILYKPMAIPDSAVKAAPKKPRQTTREKVLASLREKGESHFNTPIMTRAECDRTTAIAGKVGFA